MHRLLSAAFAAALLFATVSAPASADEVYTWHGKEGMTRTFTLKGGTYEVYVNAHYVPSLVTHSARGCAFGGTFSELSPKHDSQTLGPGGLISTGIHYQIDPKNVKLEAGTYRLFITATTTCTWTFTIVSPPSNT